MATTPKPTQVSYPWRATLRTILAVISAFILAAAASLASLAIVAPQVLEALADVLPPSAYAYGVVIVAVIGAISGTVTRILAIPGVNEWLTKRGAGATPKQ